MSRNSGSGARSSGSRRGGQRRRARAALAALLFAIAGLSGACGGPSTSQQHLARAQDSVQKQDLRTAAIHLKNALQQDPDNVEARALLGRLALESGDFSAAVRELRLAKRLGARTVELYLLLGRALQGERNYEAVLAEIDPTAAGDPASRASLLQLRADALLLLERFADAEQAYEQVLALSPKAVHPRIGLATIRRSTEGPEVAMALLAEARALEPQNPAVLSALARFHVDEKRFDQAELAFRDAATLAERAAGRAGLLPALAGLADVQMTLNKLDAAGATIARLAELAPNSTAALYLHARMMYLRGDYDTAREALEAILARDERNVPAQLLLGAVTYAQGNLGQADMYLSGVLAAQPDNRFAQELLADTRLRQRKPEAALAALDTAIKGGDGSVQTLAGLAALRSGDFDAGIAYLEDGAKARPGDPLAQLRLASGYLAVGRTSEALAVLEQVPAEQFEQQRTLLTIAALLRIRDADGALVHAERLVRSRPRDPIALAVLANVQAGRGDLKSARTHLERAAALDPRNPGPVLSLGRLDLLEGKVVIAEQRLRQMLAAKPGDPKIQIALAQCALASGRTDDAQRWLETARRDNPRAVEPRVILGQLALARAEIDKAEALAQEAAALAPGDAAVLNLLGLTQGVSGRSKESLASLELAAARQPLSAIYSFDLARAYVTAGRTEEALASARESVRRDPDYIPAMTLIGSLIAASNPAETLAVVARIRGLVPNHPAAHLLEGDLNMRGKRYAEAAQSYRAASVPVATQTIAVREFIARRFGDLRDQTAPLREWLAAHPDDHRVRLMLAQAEQQLGNAPAAIAAYEELIGREPGNAVALNNLAWLYYRDSDGRALKAARRAYEIAPGVAAIADTYGWLLVEQGELREGVKLLRDAVRMSPKAPDIMYHLAAGLARAGQNREARRYLSELVGSKVEFAERQEADRLLRSLAADS